MLEIASGTGIWTEVLVKTADTVTALDSSQEMIERCRSRLRENPKVWYVLADFYDWTPDMEYDAVTFSFWIFTFQATSSTNSLQEYPPV